MLLDNLMFLTLLHNLFVAFRFENHSVIETGPISSLLMLNAVRLVKVSCVSVPLVKLVMNFSLLKKRFNEIQILLTTFFFHYENEIGNLMIVEFYLQHLVHLSNAKFFHLFYQSCCALDCKEIHGFAKGYSYQIGDSFKGAKTNHSWTVIKIQGQWWLFDFTWGAGYVGSDRNFVWDYNEHYFMTDPEVFILDHYPKEDEWQLVERRYSIEDFEKWAKFHKHFFIHQLEVSSHRDGLVTSDDGEVEIMLSTNIPVQISSKLEFIDDDTIRVLSNYSFTYLKDRSAVFSARLSQKGRYYLKLYASKLTKDSKKSYDMVTQYQIESTRPFPDSKPFPKTFSSWVPGYILYEPMDGVLPKGKANKFKIVTHDVVEMHVCATGGQGEWTALKETTKGIWEGDVVFDNSITEATVVVKVEGQTSTTYSGILKYIVE